MDKLTMAHEYFLRIVSNPSVTLRAEDLQNIKDNAWIYADAMQAEADKRVVKLPDVFFDTKKNEEWQPDWSQSPDNMVYFAVDKNGSGWFFNREPLIETDNCWYCGDDSTELNNHNYQGNWQDSLRKRP